jgi:hypothetical protein
MQSTACSAGRDVRALYLRLEIKHLLVNPARGPRTDEVDAVDTRVLHEVLSEVATWLPVLITELSLPPHDILVCVRRCRRASGHPASRSHQRHPTAATKRIRRVIAHSGDGMPKRFWSVSSRK